jgi:hypothetical protein
VQSSAEKSVQGHRRKGAETIIPTHNGDAITTNHNMYKIYHVRTESSAKKWSQTRLPVTQHCMQQQRPATLFERAAQIGR